MILFRIFLQTCFLFLLLIIYLEVYIIKCLISEYCLNMVFHSGANETNPHKVLFLSVDFQVLYINLNIIFGFKDLSKVYFFASNLTKDTFQKGGLQICLWLTSFFLLVFLNYSCITYPYTSFPLNLPINASLLAYKNMVSFFH